MSGPTETARYLVAHDGSTCAASQPIAIGRAEYTPSTQGNDGWPRRRPSPERRQATADTQNERDEDPLVLHERCDLAYALRAPGVSDHGAPVVAT